MIRKTKVNCCRLLAIFMSLLIVSISFNASIVSAKSYHLSYDDNGNLVQGKDHYYEYNAFNQLIRVRNATSDGAVLEEYVYDENGDRIKKIEYLSEIESITHYYIGKDFVRTVTDNSTSDTKYYYVGNTLLAKNDSGTMHFYHPDHLGSTNLITNSSGDKVDEATYYPYGLSLSSASSENRLYTGKEQDTTGIYYYGARYYDPELRRFTQPDTIIPDIYDPQSLNRYSYVRNNPVKYIDETGHSFALAIVKGATALVDYVWTAFDAVTDAIKSFTAETEEERNLAKIGLSMTLAFEAAEPDELSPVNTPADDIARRAVKKKLKKELSKKFFKQGNEQAAKRVFRETLKRSEKKQLKKKWFRGSNARDEVDAATYHYLKHGSDSRRTITQYTNDALDFFKKNKNLAKREVDESGKIIYKVRKTVVDDLGKTHKPGGIFSEEGKIISFWYD